MTVAVKLQHTPPTGGVLSSEIWIEPKYQNWRTAHSNAQGNYEAVLGAPYASGSTSSVRVRGKAALALESSACSVTLEDFDLEATPAGASGDAVIVKLKSGGTAEALRALLGCAVQSLVPLLDMDPNERSVFLSEEEGESLQYMLDLTADRDVYAAEAMLSNAFKELMVKRQTSRSYVRFEPATLGVMMAANLQNDQILRVRWTRA